MCIPKRTPAQQARHEATMRAINRGKRNHPRHHNLRPLYLLACLACAAFAAAVMAAAAFFMRTLPAVAPVSSGAIRPVPGDTRGVAGAGTPAAKAPMPPSAVPPATPTPT